MCLQLNLPGTIQAGHAANNILSRKNGAQQSTNVKKTSPRTLVAFCSFATALAERDRPFLRFAKNLEQRLMVRSYVSFLYFFF